ncbi:12861_t:CDS:2 [Funneliformis geosporum]|nr:12861_t:CDS:2 [Funneliformis geosporum]
MSSDTNSQESENAIRDVLRSVRHVLAMDAFANTSTLTFLQVIMDKLVAFVSTRAVMARALMKKASKLSKPDNSPIRACAYYGDIDGKQRQKDFSNINIAWAGISFEITGHFDIVIAITNIATPVHVEAFAQMLY